MIFNKNYRLGLRATKTAIAVAICALVATFLHHEDIFCACIAAVICMEQTYEQTFDTGLHRFIGTIIGGTYGYLALESIRSLPYCDWLRILVLPLGILAVVYTCNLINRKSAVSIGCVVIIVILSRSGASASANCTLTYVIQRICDTILGIVVAMAINKFTFKKAKLKLKIKKGKNKTNDVKEKMD